MKTLKLLLKAIAKSLNGLAKQVDRATKEITKLEAAQAKKTKAAAKKKAPRKAAKKVAKKAAKRPAARKAAPKKAAAKKAAPKKAAAKRKVAKKAAPRKAAPKKAAAGASTVLDAVLKVVAGSKDGATIAELKSKTGLESRQLSNALYKLTKRGKIKAKSRGLYISA